MRGARLAHSHRAREDGRGPSIWDVFSHLPGKTHDDDTGDVADDSYHRYKEDIQLLKHLGVQTYRMSISWSRVFPTGRGLVNVPGLDYYKRVLDELHSNGITPYVTLFHWDLPAALRDGWQSRDTAKAFADYAAFIAKNLLDCGGFAASRRAHFDASVEWQPVEAGTLDLREKLLRGLCKPILILRGKVASVERCAPRLVFDQFRKSPLFERAI